MQSNDETPRPDWICEVCGSEPAQITSKVPGKLPMSVAYGQGCLDAGAHPYELLVAAVVEAGGLELAGEALQQMVLDTLAHLGKTRRRFDTDVADAAMAIFVQAVQEAGLDGDGGE